MSSISSIGEVSLCPLIALTIDGKFSFRNDIARQSLKNLSEGSHFDSFLAPESKEPFKSWLAANCDITGAKRSLPQFLLFDDSSIGERAFSLQAIVFDSKNNEILCSLVSDSRFHPSNELYEKLCDAFDGLLFAKDSQLRFLAVNKRIVEELIGAEGRKESVIGETDRTLHKNLQEVELFEYEDRTLLSSGVSRRIPVETFSSPVTGKRITLSTLKQRTSDLNGQYVVLGASTDIGRLTEEWEHNHSLFTALLDENRDPLQECAQRIIRTAMTFVANTVDEYDAAAVIQHDWSAKKFRILAAEPKEFWVDKTLEWDDSPSNSVSGHVIQTRAAYQNPDFLLSVDEIRPIHSEVRATVAVPIVYPSSNSVDENDTPKDDRMDPSIRTWGVISFVSSRPTNRFVNERLTRDLNRYATQVALAVRVSAMASVERAAMARLMSFMVEAHELDTYIDAARGSADALTIFIRKILEEHPGKQQSNDFAESMRTIVESHRKLCEILRYLGDWHCVASSISTYIRKRAEFEGDGSAAIDAIRHSPTLRQQIRKCDVTKMVNGVTEQIRRQRPRNVPRLSLHVDAIQRDSSIVACEPVLLAIIKNQIRNACKHGLQRDGEVVVKIRVQRRALKGESYLIITTINEVGPDPASRETLKQLQSFFQGFDKAPSSCLGWGSAVISFGAFLHRGVVKVTLLPSNKLQTSIYVKDIYSTDDGQ